MFFLWAPTIVVPIYAFVGAKGGVALPVLAHNSLKLGHLEKMFGIFCRYECPLPTLKISAESPQGSPINSRSREVFLYVFLFVFLLIINRSHNPVMLKFRFCPHPYLQEIFVSKKNFNMLVVGLWVDYCPDITVWSRDFR